MARQEVLAVGPRRVRVDQGVAGGNKGGSARAPERAPCREGCGTAAGRTGGGTTAPVRMQGRRPERSGTAEKSQSVPKCGTGRGGRGSAGALRDGRTAPLLAAALFKGGA